MQNKINTSLGGDALKLTTSKIVTMLISLISAMMLSRFCSLEEYGTYSQLLLVINFSTSLLLFGLPNSINYFLARAESEEEKQKFLSVYYTLSTILSVVAGLGLICATPLIVNFFDNELTKKFIYFLALYPWAIVISSSLDNILIVYRQTSFLMIYRVLNSSLLVVTIIVVQIFNLDFNTYMQLFLAVQATFAVSVYIIVKGLSKILYISFDTDHIKRILSFSIPIGLASTVGTLNIELAKLMIGNFLGVEQLAIYTNASKEMPVTIIATSLTAVLMPQMVRLLAQDNNKKAIELWGSATIIAYILICFLATSFFVFAPDVIAILYSEKYLPGVSVFRVYNIILLMRCTYFGIILSSKGETKFILYSSIVSLGLNIVLNYIFYYMFGIIGLPIATLVSQATINILQLFYSSKILRIKFKRIIPWKKITIITAINFFLGVVMYFVKDCMPFERVIGSIVESILLGCIWGGLYLTICLKEIKIQWKFLNQGG